MLVAAIALTLTLVLMTTPPLAMAIVPLIIVVLIITSAIIAAVSSINPHNKATSKLEVAYNLQFFYKGLQDSDQMDTISERRDREATPSQ